jgi:hypothetical protein
MTEDTNAQAEAPDAANAVEADAKAQVTDNPAEGEAKAQNDEDNRPFPKKAVNAITRRDRQIGKYKSQLTDQGRQLAELNRKLEEISRSNQPKSKEPNENDFDSYGDYLKALASFRPEQGQTEEKVDPKQVQEQAFKQAQQQIYHEQRVEAVAQQAQKAMKEVPGLEQMLDEFSDVLDTFPHAIEMAFLEADNAPMAFYALAKEGKLEQLADMTPTQAAMEIARAQIRGDAMVKAGKVSKAPAPIKGVKPGSPGGKSMDDMSGKELRKHYGV